MKTENFYYCSLTFGTDLIARLHSESELEQKLKSLSTWTGVLSPLVHLENKFGDYLGLGVSERGCFATYIKNDGIPPYYTASSKRKRSIEAVNFWMSNSGHVSEIPAKHIISFDELLTVAKHFCETGNLEETIVTWEKV